MQVFALTLALVLPFVTAEPNPGDYTSDSAAAPPTAVPPTASLATTALAPTAAPITIPPTQLISTTATTTTNDSSNSLEETSVASQSGLKWPGTEGDTEFGYEEELDDLDKETVYLED
ncbi:hypothetical protein LY76DRAFT_642641 [Colletotrichum caudatum]|nr:hypothetical protein LY76DRAFT_642641 [Colletotrichum caudatum]